MADGRKLQLYTAKNKDSTKTQRRGVIIQAKESEWTNHALTLEWIKYMTELSRISLKSAQYACFSFHVHTTEKKSPEKQNVDQVTILERLHQC